jgi:DNA repair exonuclease SbcCD ATPase subunit
MLISMGKPFQDKSGLLAAAEAFDTELARFARLAEAAHKGALDSQRSLERAAEALREAADSEEQLAAHAQTLMAELGQARDRQQSQADVVRKRAEDVQARTSILADLLKRYEALGEAAKELNGLGQRLAETQRAAASDAPADTSWRAGLKELYEKMTTLAASAEELMDTARQVDFLDIGKQAESLRQQLLAARNKVGLLQSSIGSAPREN